MEDRRANLISLMIIAIVIIVIIISRLCLQLSNTFYLFLGAGIAAIFAVLVILIVHARFNSRRKLLEKQIDSDGRELRIEYSFLRKVAGVPTKYRLRELEEATENFSCIIGRGASGSVFRGVLPDSTIVAVKRIEGEERGERAFKAEAAAIANVQHVNLVRLLGYGVSSGGPRFLVYDYVRNGSLDHWIFPKSNRDNLNSKSGCLSWVQRCRVAVDVAKGLSYLHHDCRSCVLHLDVKPENILIDENFRGLVADFGLAKLKDRDESRVMTGIRGTRGYLAPEWLLENGVSEKCDVYSYGMVLLEIIGGRRSICKLGNGLSSKKFQFFPSIVVEKLKEGKIMEVVDERLIEDGLIDEGEVKKMVCVALWCIQEKAKVRPSMKQVVEMLEGKMHVEDPPETKMLVVDLLSIEDENERKGHRPRPKLAQMDRESNSRSGCSFAFSYLSGR